MRSRAEGTRSVAYGFTLVELLVVTAVFLLLLGFLTSMFAGTTRAYRVTNERSEAIQDAEAVLQLIRYDLGRAGFRGVADGQYNRSFSACTDDLEGNDLGSGAACQTVRVDVDVSEDAGDRITVRFFETEYLGAGDTGERVISYSVDELENALVRQEGDQEGRLLVGNVARLKLLDYVDRSREPYAVAVLKGLNEIGTDGERAWPVGLRELAGLNVEVTFVDGTVTEFLIGLHNPQLFAVD